MPLPRPIRGIVTPLLTPLRTPSLPDEEALERMIEHVVGGGVAGVFALGTTGEGPALGSLAQRRVVQCAARAINGRVPLLVGIAHASYEEALALARSAADAGADAVVTTGPLYFGVSDDDLFGYVRRLAADSPLPLFVYNIPSCSHVSFSVDTVARCAEIENVVGAKDSSADMVYFHRLQQAVAGRDDFAVMIGPEELMAEAVLLGAHGGVNGGSNLFPELFVALYEAALRDDLESVRTLHAQIIELRDAIYEPTYLPGLKCAAAALGLCAEVFAAPYEPVGKDRSLAIREYLGGLSF